MKRQKIIGGAIAVAVIFSICGYELGQYQIHKSQENTVSYVDSKNNNKIPKNQSEADKSPDEISKEEGISAEQIVVNITDKGYVTSHGDHYHYYNGKVPYDALISEDLLMTDPNYVLKKSDIVNEVKDGYIIKVNGNYYLYLKEGSQKTNLRTKEQIAEQVAKGKKEAETNGYVNKSHAKEVKIAKSQGRYTTDDGYIFSPDDIIEDTGDAYIVPHGNHFHYIPKSDLSASELAASQAVWNSKTGKRLHHHTSVATSHNTTTNRTERLGIGFTNNLPQHSPISYSVESKYTIPTQSHVEQPLSLLPKPFIKLDKKDVSYYELLHKLYQQPNHKRHREDDGLMFDPNQVTKLTSRGFVIPHGNHWHVVPENQLSPLEIYLARMHLANQNQVDRQTADKLLASENLKQQIDSEPNKIESELPKNHNNHINLLNRKLKKTKQGNDGKPYTTDDGYHFSVDSIKSYDDEGIIANHNGHEHYIPYSDLEDSELKQVQDAIERENSGISKIESGHFTKEEITKKLHYLSLQNNIPVDRFKVTGDRVIIPHGNHTHTAELKDIPTRLEPNQFNDKEDYETLIIQLKMGKVMLDYHTKEVIRSGSDLIVYHQDGTSQAISLNSVKLPFDYQEINVSNNQLNNDSTPQNATEDIDHSASLPSAKKQTASKPEGKDNVQTPNKLSDETAKLSNEDVYDKHLQELANQYGLTKADFEKRVISLALKYHVSMENIQFGTYLTFHSNGNIIQYDIIKQAILE